MSHKLFLGFIKRDPRYLTNLVAVDELGRFVVASLFRELTMPLLTGFATKDCECAIFNYEESDVGETITDFAAIFSQTFSCRSQLTKVRNLQAKEQNINPELCMLGTRVIALAVKNYRKFDSNAYQQFCELLDLRVDYVRMALSRLDLKKSERNSMDYMIRIGDNANMDDLYSEASWERDELLAQIEVLDGQLRDLDAEIQTRLKTMKILSAQVEILFQHLSQDLDLNLVDPDAKQDELLVTKFRDVLVESSQTWLTSFEEPIDITWANKCKLCDPYWYGTN